MGCGHPISWVELFERVNPKQKNKLCTFLKYLPSQPTHVPN